MHNITSHKGTLNIIKRLASSYNGNPRYLLTVDGFKCRTGVDSSHGYCVTNYNGREVTATIGTHYGQATLEGIQARPR